MMDVQIFYILGCLKKNLFFDFFEFVVLCTGCSVVAPAVVALALVGAAAVERAAAAVAVRQPADPTMAS